MKRSALATIFLVVFIDLLGFGMVIPILPYYATAYGANATVLALLMASYSAMQFLFSPMWGRLSDRHGRRPILLICIGGIAVSMFLLGLAPSLAWLFAARLLAGFFGANIATASAYIADITPPEKRAKGMGLIGAAFGLGFLFGPAFGGLLSRFGYGAPAFAASALAVVNLLVAARSLTEPRLTHEERQAHRPVQSFRIFQDKLRAPEVGLPIILFFIVTFAFAHLETSFALYALATFGLDAQHAGMILALMAICMVAIQGGAIGPLVKFIGEANLILTGTCIMALALLTLVQASSVHAFVVILMLFAIGHAITHPSLLGLTSRFADQREQGATLGVYQSAGSLARIAGPLLAGILFDRVSVAAPFYMASLFFALAFLLTAIKRGVWKTESEAQAEFMV